MKHHLTALIFASVLTACASQPHGSGRFMQLQSKTGEVLMEMDTIAAAHMSCQTQAALFSKQRLNVRCSDTATTQPLPYWYVAHQRADHYNRSSPYKMRVRTSALCEAVVRAEKGVEGLVILESSCK